MPTQPPSLENPRNLEMLPEPDDMPKTPTVPQSTDPQSTDPPSLNFPIPIVERKDPLQELIDQSRNGGGFQPGSQKAIYEEIVITYDKNPSQFNNENCNAHPLSREWFEFYAKIMRV